MGIGKTLSIIGLIMFLILGITGGYLYYKFKDVGQINVKDSNMQITNVTYNSFTIEGYIVVDNPTNTEIPFETINYQITLDSTGEIMAQGEIPSSKITKQNITRLEFGQTIVIPDSTKQLISEPNIYSTISAKIIIDYPLVRNFPVPFEQKIDIKPQIQQMAMIETLSYIPA